MRVELYHDILARKVFEKASTEQKARLRIERFIRERYRYYQESRELLSRKSLNFIAPYLDKLQLEPEHRSFITASREALRKRIRRRRLSVAGIVLALLVFLVAALISWSNASVQKKRAEALLEAKLAMEDGDVSRAYRLVQKANWRKGGPVSQKMAKNIILGLYNSGLRCDMAHKDSIVALDVSADGSLIMTASKDGAVKVWGKDCELKAEYSHQGAVISAQLAPGETGSLVLSAGADNALILYDYKRKKEILHHDSPDALSNACFSSDGKLWAYGTSAGKVYLYLTGRPERECYTTEVSGPVVAVDISTTRFLLAATRDSIRAIGIANPLRPTDDFRAFASPVGPVEAAAFLAESVIYIRGGQGSTLANFDGSSLALSYQKLNDAFVAQESFQWFWMNEGPSLPYQLLAGFSKKRGARASYALVYHNYTFLKYSVDFSAALSFACISPDGRLILLATSDGHYEIRDADDGILRYKISGAIENARFLGDSGWMASTAGPLAHVWCLPDSASQSPHADLRRIEKMYDKGLYEHSVNLSNTHK
ncbi:MAG: hypothetical protein KDC66_09165 [Phaeodactylibacter sp.]|nr:hypothetical protein [Phaeodactylibacter sp.]MCB9274788.1 hypothetical protein [Lewinellaceae bacterium]